MPKKIIFLIILAMLSFSSCASNINLDGEVTSFPLDTVTIGATETTTISDVESTQKSNKIYQAIIHQTSNCSSTLYDSDFDNIPELVEFTYTMDFYSQSVYDLMIIYKFDGNSYNYAGEMLLNYNEENNIMYLETYKENAKIFYFSKSTFTEKNMRDGEVGFITVGFLNKYSFSDNKLFKTDIVRKEWNADNNEQLFSFDKECEKVLATFEKSKEIYFTPLWDYDDIKNGTYKEIVRETLKNQYNIE